MARATKSRASKQPYHSVGQLRLEGFNTPFEEHLDPQNRWVVLAHRIPWDEIISVYDKQMRNDTTGASHINGRVILGALIIKHMCDLSDEETILQIQENMYMQYFIGYSGFSKEAPFDPSLFVGIRKRLGASEVNAINEKIFELSKPKVVPATPSEKQAPDQQSPTATASEATVTEANPAEESTKESTGTEPTSDENTSSEKSTDAEATDIIPNESTHGGRLLIDATACPQDIAYPTDLNILNDAREKSEELIDLLYDKEHHGSKKPRTYREKARKVYLHTAQKKVKSRKVVRNAVGKQLRFLSRNIKTLHWLLEKLPTIGLDRISYKYLLVIQETYRQQNQMWREGSRSIEHRIVSIHQPHVRPIVRGKAKAKTEFGAKLHLSLTNGFAFIDHLNWEAYNEGRLLIDSVEQYKRRNGVYPREVLADKIYCTRENRKALKALGIRLVAKPLGRPSAVNKEHVRPGERNPIEGKFGQAKRAYGMDRIRARLMETSESWIASIVLVLNLVNLAGQAPLCLLKTLRLIYLQIIYKRAVLLFQ